MKQTTQRFILLALMALLALFAGCKGESPTAPPPITGTSGNGSGSNGGTPPPVGANIVLAVSTASPFTGSTSTITATVTLNNAAVPNGTAVEFATTAANANFTDTSDNPTTLIRTTTNGVAKATVTSSTAGPVTVTVTVNNVTKSVTLNFQDPVIPPLPTPTTPTITAITPATGLPTGNQTVIITGTNFRIPVRVLFDPGNGQAAKEGFVTNVTPTQITVVTPAFDLGVAQQLVANITVIVEAGTPAEQRVTKSAAFTITAPVLTPVVRALNPTSGPIDGGTRVTITGDAFEAPVQVFFGSAQAQVLNVQFHTIEVITPAARDTNPNGSGTVTGPVEVKVLNVNSGKSGSAAAAFRYIAKMQITTIAPTVGSALGGTDIVIDGIGFNDPLTVDVGLNRASVLRVSGTQILARTTGLASPCSTLAGQAITVTNADNGDFAISTQTFTYVGIPSVITSILSTSPPPVPNSSLTVVVQNPGVGLLGNGLATFTIGGQPAVVTPQTITSGTGPTTFTVVVPSTLQFTVREACLTSTSIPGTRLAAVPFPVVFINSTTNCSSAPVNVTITPPDQTCVPPPPPAASVTVPAAGCAAAGSVVAAGSATGTATITITNTGGQPLTIAASPAISGANAGDFTIAPNTAKTVAPQASTTYTITFDPSAIGPRNATVTFTTNDPANPTVPVCLSGTGT
jgi:hypothetical protein